MRHSLSTIELNPPNTEVPNGTVIWLHGLGADGNDFVPIVEHLKIHEEYRIRFIFPHAPKRPITVNHGMVMRGWYDIRELSIRTVEDAAGIQEAQTSLLELIENEKARGVPSHRIFLAGFSQGGAIALYTGLRYREPLAGIVALSTYVPLSDRLAAERSEANAAIPIFQAHGLFDPVVSLHLGQACHEQLVGLGYEVDWHTYGMPHSVLPEEINDIKQFLHRCLATWDAPIDA